MKKWALKHWISILTGVIVLSIAALLILAIMKIREDAIAQASLKASYLSAALAEEVTGKLDTLAVASEIVEQYLETEEYLPPLAQLRLQIATYIPGLANILVIGPDGSLRATSGDVNSIPADFSNFDFFRISRDASSGGFRLGRPVTGLLSNLAIIPATQRLQKKDREFAGVVLFSLDPARATEMYRRVDLGSSGALKLIGTNGTMLFGYTLPGGFDPSVIGSAATGENALDRLQSGSTGTYIAKSPVDGVERIYSWRRLANFPVIALVGLGKAEALAAANRHVSRLLTLGGLSAGLLLTLTILLNREISRRARQADVLAERNAELAAARFNIAEREQHEQQINLLMGEVNHRSKNMLAIVQAIARQTIMTCPNEFIDRFDDRIQALSASQDLLVENEWIGVDLKELIRSQLGHFKDIIGTRIELSGPPVLVSSSAAQPISMAIHELATNAGKYGALSNDIGRVKLDWSIEPAKDKERTFKISWRESKGPAVTVPARLGFGSTIICRGVRESLDAQVKLDFAPSGLIWQLQCPAGRIIAGSRPGQHDAPERIADRS